MTRCRRRRRRRPSSRVWPLRVCVARGRGLAGPAISRVGPGRYGYFWRVFHILTFVSVNRRNDEARRPTSPQSIGGCTDIFFTVYRTDGHARAARPKSPIAGSACVRYLAVPQDYDLTAAADAAARVTSLGSSRSSIYPQVLSRRNGTYTDEFIPGRPAGTE